MIAAALWAFGAASSLLLGAWLALRAPVPRATVGRTMGFGAGALLAALAYDLMPDTHLGDVLTWLSFGAGAIVFYALDGLLESRAGNSAGIGTSIALGALLDGVPESLVLGIGIAVGGSVSVGFLAAVFISNVPEALSSTSALKASRSSGWISRLWGGIALASGAAAALGYGVATQLPTVDGRYVQALAAGAVLTMLADSMMPEAFEEGGRPIALLTALGFALAAILSTF
jgi:zinc transporter, ZIP family